MPALKIVITTAGRAALTNAAHDGTLPVKLASFGVTATAFTPDKAMLALPGELKRLATLSGGSTAADTLHVTLRDDSTDSYSLRGVGLYLADGTLFGVYGQATALLEKSAQATALLAADVQFADIAATAITVGDTNFQLAAATTEVQGIVELATDAETIAGTDAVRAVTPKGLLAKLTDLLGAGAPSAFVKGLLTAASAAVFRAALAIKGAALYDGGHGNGLDADLLDGKHGSYYLPINTGVSNVGNNMWLAVNNGGGKSAGLWSGADGEVSLVGNWLHVLTVNESGTFIDGKQAWHAGNFNPVDKLNVSAYDWTTLPNKPALAAAVHSHAWGDINNPPATATRWPAMAEVSGLSAALAGKLAINTAVSNVGNNTWLAVNNGGGKSAGLWSGADGEVSLVGNWMHTVTVNESGTFIDGKQAWHAGNFDPAKKADVGGKTNNWPNAVGLPVAEDANAVPTAWSSFTNTTANCPVTGYGALWTFNVSASGPAIAPGAGIWLRQFCYDTNGRVCWRQNVNNGGWDAWRKAVESDLAGNASLASLAATGAITGASIRATGTVMAAGGFQIG